jgi:putative addiction module component (TIGR02574 family)
MENVSLSDVFELPVADRIRVAQALWDSVAEDPDQVPVTEEQRVLLEKYYQDYLANPEECVPWSEIRAKLRSRE